MDGEVLKEQQGQRLRRVVRMFKQVLFAAWVQLEGWTERRRQRRALLALDDHLLQDIGLSRADAVREGRKPFWKK